MQSTNLQKDKLELIEKIIHLEDKNTLDYIKSILNDETSEYELTNEQKLVLEEAIQKYYSGEEPTFTWKEIKINARKAIMKRNLKFTFRANIDTIVAYEFYKSRCKNLGERFLDELENCYKSIVLNYTTYKVVHKYTGRQS
ncbi:hypothetical protein [Flavobacterium sp. LB2P74]|uniref:hypothetical protein n=1 Tax=Flavobacterium sp. LB2P74 TaxID=3401717 RepID=UPI003AB0C9CE